MASIILALGGAGLALLVAITLAYRVTRQPIGSDTLREFGELIQEGAAAFLSSACNSGRRP